MQLHHVNRVVVTTGGLGQVTSKKLPFLEAAMPTGVGRLKIQKVSVRALTVDLKFAYLTAAMLTFLIGGASTKECMLSQIQVGVFYSCFLIT